MSSFKSLFLLFAIMLSSSSSGLLAQYSVNTDFPIYEQRFAIKYVPLPLLSTTPAIQFAGEVKTFPNQSFQLEYGYVNDFSYFPNDDFDGFKLKTEYRFYRKHSNHRSESITRRYFIGVQYFRKEVNARGQASVFRNNQNYQEIIPLRTFNATNAFYLVLGRVRQLSESFYFETAIGIGGKELKVNLKGLPEDAILSEDIFANTFFDLNDGKGQAGTLDFFLSFKIVYAFL